MGDVAGVDRPDDGPIEPEERQYLLPVHANVHWRSDLFALEAMNLVDARSWLNAQRITRDVLLTQTFQHELHRRMYGEVWTWAGKRRVRENNIGIEPGQIVDRWGQLLGNVAYWLDNGTFEADEACMRYYFGQREIQPFHDGNSRLARVVVNELALLAGLATAGPARYPFGRGGDPAEVRAEYLAAIDAARHGDFGPLVAVARRGCPGA